MIDCPSCERSFDSEGGMKRHHYYTHGESLVEEQKGHPCPFEGCSREFGSTRAVKVHHKKSHGISISDFKRVCEWCGENFRGRWGNPSNYCSPECFGMSCRKRTTFDCDYCGTTTTRKTSRCQGEFLFCSTECCHKYRRDFDDWYTWEGSPTSYRGPTWRNQREAALERDGHQCRVCGTAENPSERGLSVHHIIPFRDFGVENHEEANQLENLMTVCDSCHNKIEERGVAK